MWDFLELGYEAYNNNVPTILKESPPMIAMQQTIDVTNKYGLVTGPNNLESLHAGMAMTCAACLLYTSPSPRD